MNAFRSLVVVFVAVTSVFMCATTTRADDNATTSTPDWINGTVTISKLRDHMWSDGDQYRYGNNPAVGVDGYRLSTHYNGWNSWITKGLTKYDAVAGATAFIGRDQVVMPYGSSYWQTLDLSDYYHNSIFLNSGTNGLAVITNTYENYSGSLRVLYYTPDVLSKFSVFSKDSSGNVVRSPDGLFEHKLTYPDGRVLGLSTTSGITFSSNSRWMYVNIETVGQLRIDADDFSVLSFSQGFSPSYSVYTAISNSGNFVAMGSLNKGLRVYDLRYCDAEKPEYASRNCQVRNLMPLLTDEFKKTLAEPQKFDYLNIRELKFISESELRVLAQYNYDGQYKAAFFSLKLDMDEPPAKYLALGDSFSSGEGTFSYIDETNTYTTEKEYNLCHLSQQSYPFLLSSQLSFPASQFGSVACSGATSGEVVSSYRDDEFINKLSRAKIIDDSSTNIQRLKEANTPGYILQNSMVKHHSPTVATITIGGNDIGFGQIVASCIMQAGCFSNRDEREKKTDEIAAKILGMSSKLRTIRESMVGSNPKLYVLGYPKITSPDNALCSLIGQGERQRADALVEYLNESIKIAAHNAGAVYVDLSNAFINFDTGEDYRICGGSTLAVNGFVSATQARSRMSVVLPGSIYGSESYHPNKFGHALLAAKIRTLTNDFQLSPKITNSTSQVRPDDNFYKRFVGDNEDRVGVSASYKYMTEYDSILRGGTVDMRLQGSSLQLPSESGKATIQLHSEPIDLAVIDFDPTRDTTASVPIPLTATPGWHELHVLYTDIEGESVDMYQSIYVMASNEDYDGDGILNTDEPCVIGGVLGIDSDNDGVDDACDPLLERVDTQAAAVINQASSTTARSEGKSNLSANSANEVDQDSAVGSVAGTETFSGNDTSLADRLADDTPNDSGPRGLYWLSGAGVIVFLVITTYIIRKRKVA